ncbi:MAG: hypothetical protein LBJ18_02840 [Rickettsiales bacterium]|jgi:hypothetical protein|nr:hypothetical protein [Rickettsiales bacterium]
MFDSSAVVQSAISSFNNAALFSPDFFWSAVLALPIFAAFWIFAPQLRQYSKYIAPGAVAAIAIWLLTHGAYGALREDSFVSVIIALCLFVCAAFITRRAPDLKFHPFNKKWLPRADWLAAVAAVAVSGLLGAPGLPGFALQGGATALGIFAGIVMNRQNRGDYDPELVVHLMMCALVFAFVMQPEFFRFGQLGHLTVLHLLGLAAAGLVMSAYLVFRFIKPAGWLSDGWYKKFRLLSRLLAILAFVLFIITESALAFALFAAMIAAALFLMVWHSPKKTDFSELKNKAWILSLAAFGLVAALPIFICAGIVLWRKDS